MKVNECKTCGSLYVERKCPTCAVMVEHAKQARKEDLKRKREEKEAERVVKAQKAERTEADIVRQYAKVIMDKQRTRGMVQEKFKEMRGDLPNKDLWMDDDFYFSIVFQSFDQKVKFLNFLIEMFKIPDDAYTQLGTVKILNGLKLAALMGCELKQEIANEFPVGNMELRQLILDYERR